MFVSMDGNINDKEIRSHGEQQGDLDSRDLFSCKKRKPKTAAAA